MAQTPKPRSSSAKAATAASSSATPAPPARLSDAEVEAHLAKAPEWSLVGDTIQRTYTFPNFVASIAFVNAVAADAERVQHHPDMLIRYNRVTLTLSTHDSGGITTKDFALAASADALAAT
jgi:4a-hydroxytetrahydrobiopterin dehydratase